MMRKNRLYLRLLLAEKPLQLGVAELTIALDAEKRKFVIGRPLPRSFLFAFR
jgi:hypothetical protein